MRAGTAIKSWGRLNDCSPGCGIHQRPPQHMGPTWYLCQNFRRWRSSSICFQLSNQILLVVNIGWIYMYSYISVTLLANNQTNRGKYYSVPALDSLQHFYKIQSQINYNHQCFGKQKRQQLSSFFQIPTPFFPVISWLKILMFPPLLVFFFHNDFAIVKSPPLYWK